MRLLVTLVWGVLVAVAIDIVSDFGVSDWQWWAAVVLIHAGAAVLVEVRGRA
jgi:hypothetical protein